MSNQRSKDKEQIGGYIPKDLKKRVSELAKELNWNNTQLLDYCLRHCVKQYDKGRLNPKPKPKKPNGKEP